MINKFYCTVCKLQFEAAGSKKVWHDKVYGDCWKLVANCPNCTQECNQYRPASENKNFDNFVENLQNQSSGGCCGGGCCG